VLNLSSDEPLAKLSVPKDTRRVAAWRKSGQDSARSILLAAATFWRAWRHTAGVFVDAAI
jgi:hypothetical protein